MCKRIGSKGSTWDCDGRVPVGIPDALITASGVNEPLRAKGENRPGVSLPRLPQDSPVAPKMFGPVWPPLPKAIRDDTIARDLLNA